MLKIKELSEMLGLKKHTLLYHIRTKEELKKIFDIDIKDGGYYIDDDKIEILINKLKEENIISKDSFNTLLKGVKTSVKINDNCFLEKNDIDFEMRALEVEVRELKELLKGVKTAVKTNDDNFSEKNDIDVEMRALEVETKYLKELLKGVKDELKTVKGELKEKNSQIDKLMQENYINQQLMIQYQIERNKLIECKIEQEEKPKEELKWWQRLFK